MKYTSAKHTSGKFSHAWRHTRKRRVLTVLLVLFILINTGIFITYRNRTYPNTTLNGQHVGSLAFAKLTDRIGKLPLLPQRISLTYEGKVTEVTPAEIGMKVDLGQTAGQLREQRAWLPLANFLPGSFPIAHLRNDEKPLFIAVEPAIYQKRIAEAGLAYKKASTPASLVQRGGNFVIIPEIDAVAIDASGSQSRIIEALSKSRDAKNPETVELMMKKVPPAVTRASLGPSLTALQAQRSLDVSVTYQSKTKKFMPDEIGSWFIRQGPTFVLSDSKINNAMADAGLELGANVTDTTQLATSARRAVETKKAVNLSLTGNPLGKKTFTYCTAVRGVSDSEMAALSAKADSTLNAKRGWSLGSNVAFNKTADGNCEFTLWLAAADQMPSFGAICDPMWSCAVRPNIIINIDRWKGASDAWNKDGGSLEDYRTMVINHEVGHWLGFDHSDCPAAGQSAPVMQQQSIDLQGCTFSPWPSTTERTSLRNYLGL